MKPFDLQAAMRGEPIVTRDGRPAKFIGYDEDAGIGERVIVRIVGGGRESFHESGMYYQNRESGIDLFMATQRHKREVWINAYPDCVTAHNDRGAADFCSEKTRTACFKIVLDFEEGEGL